MKGATSLGCFIDWIDLLSARDIIPGAKPEVIPPAPRVVSNKKRKVSTPVVVVNDDEVAKVEELTAEEKEQLRQLQVRF